MAEDALDHVGGHLLHDVHGVVQVELVQHFLQLRVGEALDQQLLLVAVQLHEHLRRLLLGQQPEHQGQHLLVQVPAEVGDIRRLQRQEEIPQLGVPFSGDQILDPLHHGLLLLFLFKHGCLLLSPELCPRGSPAARRRKQAVRRSAPSGEAERRRPHIVSAKQKSPTAPSGAVGNSRSRQGRPGRTLLPFKL